MEAVGARSAGRPGRRTTRPCRRWPRRRGSAVGVHARRGDTPRCVGGRASGRCRRSPGAQASAGSRTAPWPPRRRASWRRTTRSPRADGDETARRSASAVLRPPTIGGPPCRGTSPSPPRRRVAGRGPLARVRQAPRCTGRDSRRREGRPGSVRIQSRHGTSPSSPWGAPPPTRSALRRSPPPSNRRPPARAGRESSGAAGPGRWERSPRPGGLLRRLT